MKLVIFDMDGVIFKGRNFWLELHNALGTTEVALKLWSTHGHCRYRYLSEATAKIWKGRDRSVYDQLISNREYVYGAKALLQHLRKREIITAIISSGPYHLALRAKNELKIDHIRANKLGFTDEGQFSGTVEIQVDNNDKAKAARSLQEQLCIPASHTMVIGDTVSDLRMASIADFSIGFCVEDAKVRNKFDHAVNGSSLCKVKQLISSASTIPAA